MNGHQVPSLRSRPFEHFRILGSFVKPYRAWLLLAFLSVVIGASLGLVFPWLTGNLVDYITQDATGQSSLNQMALLLVAVFALQAGCAYLRILSLAHAGQGIVRDVRTSLFNRLMGLPVPFFDRHQTGDISSRLLSDAGVMNSASAGSGPEAAFSLITVVGGTALLFATSSTLALVVLALAPLLSVVAWLYGRQIRRISRTYQDQIAVTNSLATEAIGGVRVIKWFTGERGITRQYDAATERVVELGNERAAIRGRWTALMTFAGSASLAAVVWLGGTMVQTGALTIGALVSFLLYALMVSRGLASLVERYSQLQNSLGSAERIFELMGEASEAEPDGHVSPARTVAEVDLRTASTEELPSQVGVRFEHVSFRYEARNQQVLNNVSFEIQPGETVALVGPSGAGKSTIAQLLSRFYEPSNGRILFAGRDIRDLRISDLRSQIAVVPQDAALFSGTIEQNIRLGRPTADARTFTDACVAANVDGFVAGFPDGYKTPIGEGGVAISGGQRQRIAIARAFITDPRILIFDEATSSLDSEAELLVRDAMERLMADRTNLVIAHRLSTIRDADRIVVLRDGRIVESGTPNELLATRGFYSKMVEQQLTL